MSDGLYGLIKWGPAISGMPADFGLSQTGTTVGAESDPISDTLKFNLIRLRRKTIEIELFIELN
jgi:hypothetical protein